MLLSIFSQKYGKQTMNEEPYCINIAVQRATSSETIFLERP